MKAALAVAATLLIAMVITIFLWTEADPQTQPPVSSQGSPVDPQQSGERLPDSALSRVAAKEDGATQSEVIPKLEPRLNKVVSRLQEENVTPDDYYTSDFQLNSPFIRIDELGRVQVYVSIEENADPRSLETVGLEVELFNSELNIAQGRIRFDNLEELAEIASVNRIGPPEYSIPQTGSVITEGAAILLADQLAEYGFDGDGVRVGVISDGANDRASAQSSDDLPLDITVFGDCTRRSANGLSCDPERTCNEGTALMEVIHDVAPGAKLAVGSVDTSLEFIQRIDDLVLEFDAHIIIDDLIFFGQPYFEDGSIAQAIDQRTDDVVFISAAGNQANRHYETTFEPNTVVSDGNTLNLHDFGLVAGSASDVTMDIVVPPNSFAFPVLQWNDRFGSSANDYDLILANEADDGLACPDCVSSSTQDGDDDPLEGVCFFNDSSEAVTTKLSIVQSSGTDKRIELFVLGEDAQTQYNISEGSVIGHAAVTDNLTVGTVNAAEPDHDEIAFYSSRGPGRIDFPGIESRPKPDLTGIDGVSVTGTGGFPSRFFGTSAAVAHVAGIAALLSQGSPSSTADNIRNALRQGATERGPAGRDNTYGTGLANAVVSMEILQPNFRNDSDGDGIIDILDESPDGTGDTQDLGGGGSTGDTQDSGGGGSTGDTQDSDGGGSTGGTQDSGGDGSTGDMQDSDGGGSTDDTQDSDEDDLTDSEELVLGTDPQRRDTDGDGMPDGFEVQEEFDPLDSTDCPAWFCTRMPGWQWEVFRRTQ